MSVTQLGPRFLPLPFIKKPPRPAAANARHRVPVTAPLAWVGLGPTPPNRLPALVVPKTTLPGLQPLLVSAPRPL